MRHLTTLILATTLLLTAGPSDGATSGPDCKILCAPRVAEQCGNLAGRDLRRCRRALVRACKVADPTIACATTSDLTRELEGRVLELDGGRTVALCADRRFVLRDPALAAGATGTWGVRATREGLLLALGDEAVGLDRDGSASLLVDGTRAELGDDDQGACSPPEPPPPPPVTDDEDAVRAFELGRVLADRKLARTFADGTGDELTLCSAGDLLFERTDGVTTTASNAGTWTVDGRASRLVLALDDTSTPSFQVELRDDGAIFLDGVAAERSDARARCNDLDLERRLTAALGGKAYVIGIPSGGTVKLGLCATGRMFAATANGDVRADWRVRAFNGVARLQLLTDAGQVAESMNATFDADGTPKLAGQSPVDEPALSEEACRS